MELFKSSPNHEDDVFNLCASAASDQATKALANSGSWHKFCGIFSGARFAPDIKTRVSCVEAMLKVLSQSREGLYTLHTRGLLPGCSLMLLAVSAMVPGDANVSHAYLGLHALEDLAFRIYLAGSLCDRQILQPMCMAVIKRKDWMPDQNRPTSTQDNAVIHRAYCELLGAWKRDGIDTKTIPIDFLTNLASFALGLSLANQEYSIQERIDIARTCVDMLWLIFEDGRQVPLSAHSALCNYSGFIVSYLRSFRKDFVNEDEHHLAEMLMKTDFIALYGRIFLLVTKGDDLYSSNRSCLFMAEMFEELQHLITGLQPVSMGLYKDFATELGKFTGQLIAWLEMDGMARLKDKVELQAAAHLCRTLVVLTNQRNEPEIWQSCAYPRCWQMDSQRYLLKPRHMCGRCNLVMYCDVYCQHAHWLLETLDSHKNQCMRQSWLP